MTSTLARASEALGVHLTPTQLQQFDSYLALLTEWSQRMNLVGNVEPAVVQQRHFLESIAFGAALREREILRPGARVLDVGAGAGFPGVVLKIIWPTIGLTLLEATAKKTAFLAALADKLDLDSTVVMTGRAETLGHDPALRGSFDLVVARAVAPMPVLLELTLPFARVGGRVVTVKGSRAADELAASTRALAVLGGKPFTAPLAVPGPVQTLVVVVKQRATAAEYPRRAGVPAKSPL
jgi:16S rRNA (guanine527-N7)-methyltransferase